MGSAQSSKQQPMVETRRSSRRLQAKSEASSGSQSEREARASPQRAASRRSPSKSPASASKSPSKRGRGRPRKQEQGEEADESPQDIPVDEEDAATEDRELEVVEQVVEKVVEQVEQAAEAEKEEHVEEEEEEDEIVMIDEEDDEEDEQDAADENDETESDDKDEDIAEYAQLAAAGLDLFGTGSSSMSSSADALTTAVTSKRTAEDIKRTLVPDQLDSGASLHATFFELKGSKRSGGAKLHAEVRAQAEAQVIQKEQGVVAHSVRQREETRKKTAGRKWFDMESDELTPEMRRDFALLRMRNYLDPKKFYKSSDHNKKLPKHFQMGTVIEGAHEFKSARMTKKERQQTFTDEIMADDSIRQYTKRVFHQVQNSRMSRGKKKAKTNHRSF